MKTLDEVITEMEGCGFIGTGADALHYLKEYQTTQMAYIKAMADLEDNPPLTWDELKQMEGKPVWICTDYGLCHWGIIDDVYDDEIYIDGEDYGKKDIGAEWQAYRKERS